MNENVTHAFEEYRKALKAEEDLTNEIQEREDKTPSAEDTQKMERIEADIDLWKKETERLVKVAGRSKEADELRAQFTGLFETNDKQERTPVMASDYRSLVELGKRAASENIPGSFDSVATPGYLESLRSREIRALGVGGGTAIDSTFIDRVHFYELDESPMFDPAVVTLMVTPRGEALSIPRLTADATVAGTLTAEAAALTEADPSLSTITLNAYKYGGIQLWSSELDEDNVINLSDILARSAARHIVEQANSPLTIGDGNSKPNGIVTAAGNGGTAAGTAQTGGDNFFGWPDLVGLQFAVKPAYRRRGKYLVASTAFAKVRKFRDANGSPIFQPPLAAGQPDTFNGFPIYENPDMAAAGSASQSVIFGDTQQYIVRRVGSARVAVSADYKFSTDQLAIRVTERLDGDLLDANAVVYLVSANV